MFHDMGSNPSLARVAQTGCFLSECLLCKTQEQEYVGMLQYVRFVFLSFFFSRLSKRLRGHDGQARSVQIFFRLPTPGGENRGKAAAAGTPGVKASENHRKLEISLAVNQG